MSSQRRSSNRRVFLKSAAAASLLIATGARAQSAWPDRAVKIIVPYPAGGSTDVLARILADRLNQIYGQPFVIENRPGAGGNIGIGTVSSSAPDGYTIGAATIANLAISPFLYASMPYDAAKDLIPASMTWELPNVFVVASEHVPAKTLAEFIVWAKQKGHVSFGSPGIGTSPHLSGVLFDKRAGLDAVHVPFRGAAQTIPAMLSGAVDFALDNLASYIGLIEFGKNARAGGDLGPALADFAERADHGRGRHEGFRRHLLDHFRISCRYAASDRRQAVGDHEADRRRYRDPETLSDCRRARAFQHAGRGHRVRRQGAGQVERRSRAVGPQTAIARCPCAAREAVLNRGATVP